MTQFMNETEDLIGVILYYLLLINAYTNFTSWEVHAILISIAAKYFLNFHST